jgi:hypothetical protein
MQKHVKCRDWIGRCNCLAYRGFQIPAASQVMLLTLMNRANCPTSTPRRHATCTLYARAVTSASFGAVKDQMFTALFPGSSRVDCHDVFSFFGAGCGLGLRSARGATKGSPSPLPVSRVSATHPNPVWHPKPSGRWPLFPQPCTRLSREPHRSCNVTRYFVDGVTV